MWHAWKGSKNQTPFPGHYKPINIIFISSLHLQLLIGLLLYFVLSPITKAALNDFGAAMKDASIRYWAMEHSLMNVIAIAIAQTGSILAKKKSTPRLAHRTMFIWTLIAFILILLMIPMGIMGPERPWFKL
ncbi:hypothetical protein MASR1M74_02730 [Lentimicrobium sp.]